jgi:hypothetical protein
VELYCERSENVWRIRIHRQISNGRKATAKLAKTGTDSDNDKLNSKKGKIFKKYEVMMCREMAWLTETMKQKG